MNIFLDRSLVPDGTAVSSSPRATMPGCTAVRTGPAAVAAVARCAASRAPGTASAAVPTCCTACAGSAPPAHLLRRPRFHRRAHLLHRLRLRHVRRHFHQLQPNLPGHLGSTFM